MEEQRILSANNYYKELDEYFLKLAVKKILLVCGNSIVRLQVNGYFQTLTERIGIEIVRFSEFKPNPQYRYVEKGVEFFCRSKCDAIVAVGGGSAMDVAKCIKLYANMDTNMNYLKQEIVPNNIPLIAIPTTAGTGSETTRFAVIYHEGEKQSVADYSCIPEAVVFDSSTLEFLPDYHRKASMMDALCHAMESFWSVNSTVKSQQYSIQAIRMIMESKEAYLENNNRGNANMLKAANMAGKAINITQTTAGHAMCYKLSSLYGIAHGHAAALCIAKLWPFMIENTDRCIDPRGVDYLKGVFSSIAEAMGCNNVKEAVSKYTNILSFLFLDISKSKEADYEVLRTSVNFVRLKNNPVWLDEETIDELYHQILA